MPPRSRLLPLCLDVSPSLVLCLAGSRSLPMPLLLPSLAQCSWMLWLSSDRLYADHLSSLRPVMSRPPSLRLTGSPLRSRYRLMVRLSPDLLSAPLLLAMSLLLSRHRLTVWLSSDPLPAPPLLPVPQPQHPIMPRPKPQRPGAYRLPQALGPLPSRQLPMLLVLSRRPPMLPMLSRRLPMLPVLSQRLLMLSVLSR